MEAEKKKVNLVFLKIPDSKTELEKVASTVATFQNDNSTARLLRRVINYGYHEVISESVKASTTQMASEKVDNTVTTFLSDYNIKSPFKRAVDYRYYQKVSVSVKVIATKMELKKVTNMVDTFLSNLTFPFSNSHTITQIRGC